MSLHRPRAIKLVTSSWVAALSLLGIGLAAAVAIPPNPLATTLPDWHFKGTQPTPPYIDGEPNPDLAELFPPNFCAGCHGYYNPDQEPYTRWQHSMMAQAFRDPVFRGTMAIAQQDAHFVGDTCIRCHAPAGWIQARNEPSDGSNLQPDDKEGVTCHTCHRMVDPDFKPGISPSVDMFILSGLAQPPDGLHSNAYVIDPKDRRRGPFDLGQNFTIHRFLQSPFHETSDLCAACHDASNPAFVKQPDGSFALSALDAPHETLQKEDMFPEQRTYSEWKNSAFAAGPVDFGTNRFGGQDTDDMGIVIPRTEYSTCQECHMPDTTGTGCEPFLSPPVRDNLPLHNFNGVNSWVLRAVKNLYDDSESHLFYPEQIDNALSRNMTMLRAAADLTVTTAGSTLMARVTNQTGHKLPTGYPEGRRIWLNVRYFDANNALIAENGAYDPATAQLDTSTTRVYETVQGLDTNIAAATGLTAGPSFHLALVNKVYFDNRIPPRGFTNAGLAAASAEPVGVVYPDGQNWDDAPFPIPGNATRAEVRLFHQTSTKEYMEFVRDEDVTIPFDRDTPWGTLAYQQWVALGKSTPVEMSLVTIPINLCRADFNGDNRLDPDDLSDYINAYFSEPRPPEADFNGDGITNPDDLSDYINAYFDGCP